MSEEKNILYQTDNYFVIKAQTGGYEVYRNESTHSVRCDQIGYKGQRGLQKAIFRANAREGICPQCKEKAPEIICGLPMCFDCDEKNFSNGIKRAEP